MAIRAAYDMTVKIQEESTKKEEVYFLVRVEEENWTENKISMYHPIGKALFSKEAGNVVEAFFDNGTEKRYKIIEIEPT